MVSSFLICNAQAKKDANFVAGKQNRSSDASSIILTPTNLDTCRLGHQFIIVPLALLCAIPGRVKITSLGCNHCSSS